MSQTFGQIKNRIRSIENTQKVTGALQMISVTKLNRMNNMLSAASPYFDNLEALLANLCAGSSKINSPFFRPSPGKKKLLLCLITSDGGLCGVYNSNIIRLAEDFISRNSDKQIELVTVGRKGYKYFLKRSFKIAKTYLELQGRYSPGIADEVSRYLIEVYSLQGADEIYLAYTHLSTLLVHQPRVKKFLNLEISATGQNEYILEPGLEGILEKIIPLYLCWKMRLVILDAFTSEHAARTISMKMATENAKELLHNLVLLRNKVRQANITRDILEIISSAEALKG